MAEVDVLIPVYNAAKTIRSAVESMQRQTLDNIVIHIVDDGSSDETPSILRDMAKGDTRICIHTKRNGGIVDALNDGLKLCRAEFVARHDADDIAYPERLAIQVDYLRRNPSVGAVGAAVKHIDSSGAWRGSIARLESPDNADCWAVPAREPYLIHPFLTVRRSAIMAAAGYRYVSHAEDSDLYWRLSEHHKLVNLPDLLGEYRIHDESISGSSITNGRIQAISSQLAALSAQRRRSGRPDRNFPKDGLASLKSAGSLGAMMAIATEGLINDERAWMEEAVAAKLLELTGYRPYEPDAEDCAFIGRVARRGLGHLSPENRARQIRVISGSAARLAASKRFGDAIRMVPPSLYPSFAMRYVARLALPEGVRHAVRALTTGSASVVK